MSRRNGRVLAFQAAFAWEISKTPLEELLQFSWVEAEKLERVGEAGLAFARLLLCGTLEHLPEIDAAIEANLARGDYSRVNRVDVAILRISVYALLYQKDIHPFITIDEAVCIAQDFSTDDSYKFVNAVLDNIRKNLPDGENSR
ncbi:transcription antitermination factor NusB [Treponema endosymbiont of Eucomonympha sp.]|uniref:transcription antitermination factor NusB n=1 Tax=Treponema endosymbiont of Eucomonympha sp. TaxID=1580831 RepID=UPI0007846C24|nr:transcription antitermination factor NusB [Treponema endosymbiont of Eucomonympha sp.]